MATPKGPGRARGADGRFIGRGFIEIVLKDSTDEDLERLKAKLTQRQQAARRRR